MLKSKIIFNCTLLAISYISCIQFTSLLASFFLYWYALFLVFRIVVYFREFKGTSETQSKKD